MASNAIASLGRREESVKTALDLSVPADVFMAGNAQRRQGKIGLSVVTCATIGLKFCVAIDNAARHEQLLNARRARRCNYCQVQ
jgi:hypothetical protein